MTRAAVSPPSRCIGASLGSRVMPCLYRPSLLLEDFLSRLFPVREKGGKSFIGQRMRKHLLQHLGRQGGDVGAHLRSLDDMDRVAHGSDQYLGVQLGIVAVDRADVGDELHSDRKSVV